MNARNSKTILIVEDDAALRETLADLFKRAGWTTAWASDGEDALAYFRADPADLVLTDIIMPGMTGIELIRRIRGFDVETPILILTGFASYEHCVEALRSGANDFIDKPFENEALIRQVEEAHAGAWRRRHPISLIHPALRSEVLFTISHELAGHDGWRADLLARIDAFAMANGWRRRRLAIARSSEIILDEMTARIAKVETTAAEAPLLSVSLVSHNGRLEISFASAVDAVLPRIDERPASSVPEAASSSERQLFLLRSFCDEIASSSDRLTLRYLSAAPGRNA
jgi:CheY-like chemotaxis protein